MDPVAEAIASVGQAPVASPPRQPVRMQKADIRLSSGRIAQVAFPSDISDTEITDLVGQITTSLRVQVRQANAGPASRLILPRRG